MIPWRSRMKRWCSSLVGKRERKLRSVSDVCSDVAQRNTVYSPTLSLAISKFPANSDHLWLGETHGILTQMLGRWPLQPRSTENSEQGTRAEAREIFQSASVFRAHRWWLFWRGERRRGVNWRVDSAHSGICVCLCVYVCVCMCTQSCPTLYDPMDCNPPGSSVHGIFQARIPEWVAISFSRRSSWFRNRTRVSCVSCIGRQILYHWTTWEVKFWTGKHSKV